MHACLLAATLGFTAFGAAALAVPLPQFSSSDPRHDDLLNDLFVRHGRATFSDNSLRRATAPNPLSGTVSLWRD